MAGNNFDKIKNYVENYAKKSGTVLNPNKEAFEAVINGLVKHKEELGKPLCPCNFYPDKKEEIKRRKWICPCDEMQIFKYCHCLLFTNEAGLPITEYLPDWHEGKQIYGLVKDPSPEKGRALAKFDKAYNNLKEYIQEHKLDITENKLKDWVEKVSNK